MFKKGTKVQWNYSRGKGVGKVKEVFKHDVEKNIKGSVIKRKAYPNEEVYLIEQDDGDEVLKSASEIKKAS